MRRIGFAHGQEPLAFAGIVAGFQNVIAEDGHALAPRSRGSQGDQHASAAFYVAGERIFKRRGQGKDVGKHHERVLGRQQIRRLIDADALQSERRLRGRSERGAEVKRRARIVRLVDEQHLARIGALDGKEAYIVGGQGIGRIDPDFAAAETIRHVERFKLHGGASTGGHLDGLRCDRLAVRHQRNRPRCRGSVVAGDHRLDARLLRVPDLTRRIDAFHRPVRHRSFATGCRTRETVAGKAISWKLAAMADLCMSLNRCSSMGVRTLSVIERIAVDSSPKLPRASLGWMLATAARSVPGSTVGWVSTCSCEPSAITCACSAGLRESSTERASLRASASRGRRAC